jgi:hypothetical protein
LNSLEHLLFVRFTLGRDQILLQFADFVETTAFNELFQLLKDVEMLGGTSFALLELWKVLDHPLHVFDRLELRL